MEKIIEVNNLVKEYKVRRSSSVKAIKDCTFAISKGNSVGFVGLNGAGKSSTIKALTGIIKPTSGNIKVLGNDPYKYRKETMRNIGVLFGQRSNLIYDLPVIDSFKLLKAIYRISDRDYTKQLEFLGEFIDLESLKKIPVRKLSLGQRMRCEVASILIHNPKVVFFDEAFLGIDFKSKGMIRKLIDAMRTKFGTTFFITSHDIRDIERMCEDVIIINNGEIIRQDTIQNVLEQSKWIHLEIKFEAESNQIELSELNCKVLKFESENNMVLIKTLKEGRIHLLKRIDELFAIKSYELIDCNLEDIIESIDEEMRGN